MGAYQWDLPMPVQPMHAVVAVALTEGEMADTRDWEHNGDAQELCRRLAEAYDPEGPTGHFVVLDYSVCPHQHDDWGSFAPVARMDSNAELLTMEQCLRGQIREHGFPELR